MIRPRTATRLACALALLAVLLRVAMPALHDHHHHVLVDASSGSQVEVCSCGAVHAPSRDRSADVEHGDSSHDPHHCLACEVEEGTPCDCPPEVEEPRIAADWADNADSWRSLDVVASKVRLPQPRAPPTGQI